MKLKLRAESCLWNLARCGLANGAVLVRYGDTVVSTAATASDKPREGIDFFPLSIDYEERMYAVGKIPGGFTKREGRPSENAILTARVIDRPMRPLFPKDLRNDVSIVSTVLSVEQDNAPEFCAMIGSSVAVSVSDIRESARCGVRLYGQCGTSDEADGVQGGEGGAPAHAVRAFPEGGRWQLFCTRIAAV